MMVEVVGNRPSFHERKPAPTYPPPCVTSNRLTGRRRAAQAATSICAVGSAAAISAAMPAEAMFLDLASISKSAQAM